MITSTGSAVGIAQSSPSYTLDVTGTGRFTSSVTASNFYAISSSEIRLYNSNNTNWGTIKGSTDSTNGYITLTGGSGNGMIVANSGNVGIGTSSPSYLLDVNGSSRVLNTFLVDSATTAELRLRGGNYGSNYNTSLRSITGAAGVLQFGNNDINYILVGNTAAGGYLSIRVNCASESVAAGTEAMRITNAGHVLINQTSYNANGALEVTTLSGQSTTAVFNSTTTNAPQIYLRDAGGAGQANIMSNSTIVFKNGTSFGETMRIVNNGNVLVGGTSAIGKLSVIDNSAKTVSDIPFGLGSNTAVLSQMQLLFYRNINLYFNIQAIEQGTAYRSIYLNLDGGAVYAGTQRLDNNSDARVKENIQPIGNALNTILSLKGRKFNMIDEDNVLRYGFIAQEVQPILNDFVTESTRSYKKGDDIIENLLTLETSGAAWAALLVEAIKEQQKQIEELKLKIK